MSSPRLVSIVRSKTLEPLKNSLIFRGDQEPLQIKVVEPNQTGATFRFVARLFSEHPNGSIQILKSGNDFTTIINDSGNVALSSVVINSMDTEHFYNTTTLIYDLERTIGSDITTLEQGVFTIVPDVAINR